MHRLLKYFKPFIISVICIIALLYTQAQLELALPDYLSNIVTNGIQYGGIETSVPNLISKDTMDHALLFMDDEEQTYVLECYELKSLDEEFIYDIDESLDIVENGVYELVEVDDETISILESYFSRALLIVSSIDSMESGEVSISDAQLNEFNESLPDGVDFYTALTFMDESTINSLFDAMDENFDALGDSTISLAAISVVQSEYANLGVDVEGLQNDYILSAGLIMLLISLGGVLCAICAGYFSSKIAASIAARLRSELFQKIESFSVYEFNKFSTASLITRTTNDIQQIQMALMMTLRIIIYAPILGVGAILHVWDSNVTMLYIIIVTVIVLIIFIFCILMSAVPKFSVMQKLTDKLNLVGRESLNGMLVVRAFGREKYEEEKFDQANIDIMKTGLFTGRIMSLLSPVITFIMSASSLFIVWVGANQVDIGALQIGEMMAFIQYAMQVIMSFMMISMVSMFISRGSVSAKRYFEVMDTELSIHDPKQPLSFDSSEKGRIKFNNVCFAYPHAEENTLNNISFESFAGQTTAFIGGTGSGKSTLINLIPRFFDVSSGSIEINGLNIKEVSQKDLRDKIGLVPQKGILFSGTIESNIKYSCSEMSDEQMELAANVAQAIPFIEEKNEGYQSSISQGGTNVSGGQKQRLAIARAIAKAPEIYIFDDSFSALDFKTDANLREALNDLCAKTHSCVLLIGQRVASIMNADQIIVLDEGSIVGKGTHEQLMKTCEVYQEIAYSQLSKEELGHE